MTQLVWDSVGESTFEAGVSKGVLYLADVDGVAWNGLISVTRKNSGQVTELLYFDGRPYLNHYTPGDFKASMSAFTYPVEFEACEGAIEVEDGLVVTQQDPIAFGLSWKTQVGNDVESADFGHKIHLLYEASATLPDREYTTHTQQINPTNFGWDLTALPVDIPGSKPSPYMFVDSRRVSPVSLMSLENVLYGVNGAPRLPLPDEIVELMILNRFIVVVDDAEGVVPPDLVQPGDAVFSIANRYLYYGDGEVSRNVRDVIVIDGDDISLLPDTYLQGDLVLDESTGTLYQIGA